MAMERVPMTTEGFHTLEAELHRLKSQERPRIIQAIAEARAHGDLSENAEYHAAKEAQGLNEAKVAELEDKLSRADVIDVSTLSGETVKFGATVKLVDEDTEDEVTYKIVGDLEANLRDGKISISSPIARALIGKTKGESVEVTTPKGARSFEILSSARRQRDCDAGFALDAADRQERLHTGNIWRCSQIFEHEILQFSKVTRNAPHHEVGFPRQHVGVTHTSPPQYQILERPQVTLRLLVQPDHCIGRQRKAERRLVQQHRISDDQTAFFKRADASQTSRRRQSDPGRQGDVGNSTVILQFPQDLPIDEVEFECHGEIRFGVAVRRLGQPRTSCKKRQLFLAKAEYYCAAARDRRTAFVQAHHLQPSLGISAHSTILPGTIKT
jgi:transcription elongation factor GreA